MINNNKILKIIQSKINSETIKATTDITGYKDTSRKLKVSELFYYFIVSSVCKFKSFRESEIYGQKYGLLPVDYSTLSKKSKEVPYQIFKDLFENLIKSYNHNQRRFIQKKLKIKAIDSSLITFKKEKTRQFAEYKKNIQGVKIHLSYDVLKSMPDKVVITNGKKSDSKTINNFKDKDYILVCDRGYADYKQFDEFEKENQEFIIRIKDNSKKLKKHSIQRFIDMDSKINILEDYTCILGNQKINNNRYRIVTFLDSYDRKFSVCTNIKNLSAYDIAAIYKSRWQIEVFFRFIKQNLNIKNLFANNENGIFIQLYSALIAYVIILLAFTKLNDNFSTFNFSICEFIRLIISDLLQPLYFFYLIS